MVADYSVYVAGPMRDHPEFNFPRFDSVTEAGRKEGWTVFSPAEHDREVYPDIESWDGYAKGDISQCPGFDFHAAMRWDLRKVTEVDCLVLLPGWSDSTGARHELYVAKACGLDVLFAHPLPTPGAWAFLNFNAREDPSVA